MNLQQMEVFLAIVETGTYTAAGEKTGYTQSRVTQMMKALENEIGFPLFVRSHYGAALTRAGESLLPTVKRIWHDNESLNAEISDIRGLKRGTLNIGTYTSCSVHWLPPVIAEFREKYPDIDFNVTESGKAEIIAGLEDRSFDIALTSRPENDDLDFISLYRDPVVVVFPSGHEFSENKRVDIHKLEGRDFIMSNVKFDNDVTRVLGKENVKPNVVVTSMDDFAIMSMVLEGIGIAMLPELVIRDFVLPDVEYRELDPPQYRELGIVVPSVRAAGPITRTFMGILMTYFE